MNHSSILILHKLVEEGAGICTDSRKAAPNQIFFALKGEQFDGNRFALNALKQGCKLAVVDDPELDGNDGCLLVDDVLETLQELGKYHRHLFDVPVIGITGSNGKTTTKELMHRVLAKKFITNATIGNLNNHIGVPLTLLSYKNPMEVAIVEMGANHMGEIANLCRLAMPQYGIITNIGKAHLEGFGSIENIARAKGELYDYIRQHNGTLFVNNDHEVLRLQAEGAHSVRFGWGDQNHCSGKILESFPTVEIAFRTHKPFGQARVGILGNIRSKLTGVYNAENILAAVTIGLYFGVAIHDIIDAIESYEPSNSRSQLLETASNAIILDAYNANPTSMAAAIENFRQFTDRPRAVILGDMLEMGHTARQEHEAMVQRVLSEGFDLNIFVGSHFVEVVKENSNTKAFTNAGEAGLWLEKHPIKGHRVLVKGSRSIQLEKLIPYL
jgi:UDP-N-acetylmuramoyl-tripeptide--D-alanyl-D-alanine ligase